VKILVASTMCSYTVRHADPRLSQSWLQADLEAPAGVELEYFAALELDSGGVTWPFIEVMNQVLAKNGSWWFFTLHDGRTSVTTANRLHHIITGRNLVQDYAVGNGHDWVLFLDADMQPPPDAIPKLLELDWPVVGGHVPTYGLSGPRPYLSLQPGRDQYPESWDVQIHMNTAGFLMVRRDIFRKVRWRVDPDLGMTDDPCYHADTDRLGYPTFVRHDVVGRHYPEALPALEQRGYDLTVSADQAM
jgi:hypothetical protein